ncbi:unnamed protein product [Peronospora farinosa]|uniref:Uncharacterized protein n=1 Tax=Peronospora farinosa TaxID=134698 RepID=A0ABN8BTR4_9STRA|nr:unnamed protein product [Peronospora farinosa]
MSSIPSKKLFVFGLGYSASRAAHAFHSIGYQVSAPFDRSKLPRNYVNLIPSCFDSSHRLLTRKVFSSLTGTHGALLIHYHLKKLCKESLTY